MQHVLIIEDQPLIANTLAEMARFAGAASVDIADTVADAVAAAGRRSPDIIISDVDLGTGGHGPTAVTTIHDRIGPIPAISVTGRPDDEMAKTCAAAVLPKPVSAQRLAAVMAAVVAALRDRQPPHLRRRSIRSMGLETPRGHTDAGAGMTMR